MPSSAIAIAVHLLASTLWVGGMFFSLMILRPCCLELDPPVRLKLMSSAVRRFLSWVWVAVALLLATGYWMVAQLPGGRADLPWHVVAMLIVGHAMAAIFLYAFFGPYQKMQDALATGANPDAGTQLNAIRGLIQINLGLGVILVLCGGLGRYLNV